MPLLLEEITPGTVAVLDVKTLLDDPEVYSEGQGTNIRPGPLLCVQVKDGKSVWLLITSQRKGNLRLKINPEWKIDGSPLWQGNDNYINDARKPFFGPLESFVKAGANELPHQPHKRHRVSEEGVSAVIEEVKKYGVKLL